LPESNDEVQRLNYCLKLNLRLTNGRLNDFKVYQVGNNTLENNDRFQNKTNIECMEFVHKDNHENIEGIAKAKDRFITKN
jgi:hypothetical protein